MRTPRYLLGAALLFWSWQTGYWVTGLLMALVLESAPVLKARWEVSRRDFERLWDFTSILFLALAAYAFTANEGPRAFKDFLQGGLMNQPAATLRTVRAGLTFVQWWPMTFFLLAAAQAYSTREELPWTTFSLVLRLRRRRQGDLGPEGGVNLGYPYFGVCLAAASVSTQGGRVFYPAVCVLVAAALWRQRSMRFSPLAWAGALALAIGLGYAGQAGLRRAQQYVEDANPEWLLQWFRRRSYDFQDPNVELGRIGRLKLSGRIVLRVEPKEGGSPPPLLRETSYRKFTSPVWRGTRPVSDFGTVVSESNATSWLLLPEKRTPFSVQIAQYLPGGRGRLALPFGTARLDDLSVGLLRTNQLGAVLADVGSGLVIYDARYGPGQTLDAPPTSEDYGPRSVSERERAVLAGVAAELNVAGKTTPQKLEAVKVYFSQNFRYSTFMRAPPRRDHQHTPLTYFLQKTRAGHCEYFATATVLLLRQLGVPARYAVGYSVQEKSGSQYLVRERHGHAWCLVYVGKQWRDFDTTPASWFEAEAQDASASQVLWDFWSRVWFEFNRWRWGQTSLRQHVLWVLGGVLALLVAQLILRKEWKRLRHSRNSPRPSVPWPGLDSEFYLLLERVTAAGWPPLPGEALWQWLTRLTREPALAGKLDPLRPILDLHYRYRFDPAGITPAERERLRDGCRAEILV